MAEVYGLRYVIVGGVALAAWTGEEFKPERSNGTAKDIDVIVIEDPKNCAEEIEKRLLVLDFKVLVSFNYVKPEEYRSRVSLFPQLKRTEKGYSFVFRSVEVPMSEKALELHSTNLVTADWTMPIRTLHPYVLLHRYLIRLGVVRVKDREKVRVFARQMKKLDLISFSNHANYREYHEFARRVREKYPWYIKCSRAYCYIDHYFFNSLLSHWMPRSVLRYVIAL